MLIFLFGFIYLAYVFLSVLKMEKYGDDSKEEENLP